MLFEHYLKPLRLNIQNLTPLLKNIFLYLCFQNEDDLKKFLKSLESYFVSENIFWNLSK